MLRDEIEQASKPEANDEFLRGRVFVCFAYFLYSLVVLIWNPHFMKPDEYLTF